MQGPSNPYRTPAVPERRRTSWLSRVVNWIHPDVRERFCECGDMYPDSSCPKCIGTGMEPYRVERIVDTKQAVRDLLSFSWRLTKAATLIFIIILFVRMLLVDIK